MFIHIMKCIGGVLCWVLFLFAIIEKDITYLLGVPVVLFAVFLLGDNIEWELRREADKVCKKYGWGKYAK